MAVSYKNVNGIWVKGFDSTDLGVTPGVTTVAATPLDNIIDWRGFRQFGGFLNYTLGAGVTLNLSFIPLAKDGVTPMGNGLDIGFAGGTQLSFQMGPGWANNGQYDILGVGNGTFNNAGRFPPAACELLRVRIARTAGANPSTLGVFNFFVRS